MEGLVAQVVALSNPNDQSQLLTTLKGADNVFNQNYGSIPVALQALDPGQHSLGYLFLLHHLGKGNLPAPDAAYIDNATRFFLLCDRGQIQQAPDIFCAVSKKLKEHLLAARCPRRGIRPLLAGLRALQPSPEVLTPLHADFFQLCLLAQVYNAASAVLAEDIFDVAPAQTACTPTDLFLYCYYGGMLCIGRKQHARALELLLQAVTAPALAPNAIVAAAYKKYVLVCLIHAGQLLQLPKYTSSVVKQLVESDARPYNDLATAYASRNAERLRRVVDQHQAVFGADNNLGLVMQVVSSLAVRSIQRLTQTFLTLSLADIAANTGLAGAAEAEARIVRMVATGQIHAKIDGRSGMVRFADETHASASTSASGPAASASSASAGARGMWESAAGVAALDERMRQVLELGRRLQQAHEMVSQDRAYLSKITARERSKYELGVGGGGGGGGGLSGLGGSGPGGSQGTSGGDADFGPFAAGGGSNM